MKVLLITSLFQPEPNFLKGLEFVKKCNEYGADFEILTGMPNYPDGKVYSGYRKRFYLKETLSDVVIYRVPHYVSHNTSAAGRIISYITFALSCSIFIVLKHRYDIVYVYQGPATLSIPGFLFKLLTRKPFILDVQDIWPQSLVGSGMLKLHPLAISLLDRFCDLTYRFSDKILVLSEGYKRAIISRGVDPAKIKVIYNWCDESSCDVKNSISQPVFNRDSFNVVYAGNIGPLQNLSTIVDSFKLLKDRRNKSILYIFGTGIEEAYIKQYAKSLGVDNVIFCGRLPFVELKPILKRADALLLHLKNDPLTLIGVPQKTQTYLEAGVPIIAAIHGDAAALIEESRGGIVCEPQNADSIASAIAMISETSDELRSNMARNGASFYYENMSFERGVRSVMDAMNNLQ